MKADSEAAPSHEDTITVGDLSKMLSLLPEDAPITRVYNLMVMTDSGSIPLLEWYREETCMVEECVCDE